MYYILSYTIALINRFDGITAVLHIVVEFTGKFTMISENTYVLWTVTSK